MIVTLMPGNKITHISLFKHMDKVVHFILFFVFTLVLITDLAKGIYPEFIQKFDWLIAVGLGIFIGMSTELIQYFFILGRTGSVYDFLSDISGVAVGLSGYWLLRIKE